MSSAEMQFVVLFSCK